MTTHAFEFKPKGGTTWGRAVCTRGQYGPTFCGQPVDDPIHSGEGDR